MKEEFKKYITREANFHWGQIGPGLRKRNIFALARYKNCIQLLENEVKTGKVLDAGCGDGVFSYLVSKKGYEVSGVDLSKEAIDAAKEITKKKGQNIDFRVASVYELPYEDNYFDAVVSTEVIEHLDDVDKFLDEIKRVTKKEGTIVISTPIRLTREPLDPEHVVEWFEEDYKEIMDKYFEKPTLKTSHPVIYFDLYQARFFGPAVTNTIQSNTLWLKNKLWPVEHYEENI